MGYYDRNEKWYEHKDGFGNRYFSHNPYEFGPPLTKGDAYIFMVFTDVIAFVIGLVVGEMNDGLWVAIGLAIGVGLFLRWMCNEAFKSHLETTKAAIKCAVIIAIILIRPLILWN